MVAGDPAGVSWRWGETGDAGEPVDGFERVQIAAGVREERRRQYGAESGHAEQDRRVTVLIEPLTDLLIELRELGIDGGDLPGELSDELRRDRLSTQNGALGVGRVHGSCRQRWRCHGQPRFFSHAVNRVVPTRRIVSGVW